MRMRTVVVALLATSALIGCGGEEEPSSPGSGAGATETEERAFPATIEHKYGETTVEAAPKRVVVAGLREQDALLALGVVPVATTEWYGEQPGAIFPWAKAALGDAEPPATVLNYTDGIQVEKIAAQRPDLIIAVYSGLKQEEYEQLSQIAPTVAQPPDQPDYGSSWQEETLTTGEAIGKPQAAQELVDETEQLIADTAAEHPEFEGQQGLMVSNFDGTFVYGPDDVRNRLLTELGFEYPPNLVDAFPERFGGELSAEQVDRLDVGALIWFTGPKGTPESITEANPGYDGLAVSREGRDVFIADEDSIYNATSFVSVLSMPSLMDELVPRIAAAADGDPATPTDGE